MPTRPRRERPSVGTRLLERQSLLVQVQGIEGFTDLVDALRALSRMPGVTLVRALRLWRGEGVFEVTATAPVTREALAQATQAALGRVVRVEQQR